MVTWVRMQATAIGRCTGRSYSSHRASAINLRQEAAHALLDVRADSRLATEALSLPKHGSLLTITVSGALHDGLGYHRGVEDV